MGHTGIYIEKPKTEQKNGNVKKGNGRNKKEKAEKVIQYRLINTTDSMGNAVRSSKVFDERHIGGAEYYSTDPRTKSTFTADGLQRRIRETQAVNRRKVGRFGFEQEIHVRCQNHPVRLVGKSKYQSGFSSSSQGPKYNIKLNHLDDNSTKLDSKPDPVEEAHDPINIDEFPSLSSLKK